jgi:NADPH-dependent 7-cyano-7-deazaguanine reductase QueF-like protein
MWLNVNSFCDIKSVSMWLYVNSFCDIKSVSMWLYVNSFCNIKYEILPPWRDFILQNQLTYSHIPTLFITNVNQYSNSVT